jgi:S1-C subfamily serine protease
MRSVRRALVLFTLLMPPTARADDPSGAQVIALQQAVERAIERAEQSVVCIGTWRELRRNQTDLVPESYGSGLVIDSAGGKVLTCAHVVRNSKEIEVRLPGGATSSASIYALDPRSDLAVISLATHARGLHAVKFGDGGRLKKGQFVVGLANPYRAGYRDGSASASWGIVSNLTRRAPGVIRETDRLLQSFHRYGTLIQTDVRIAQGCSGGAIVNLDGEVVGITTAMAALEGIDAPGGFAIPVDARMRGIIEVLRQGKEIEYGFLGVMMMRPEQSSGQGAHIDDVIGNGPAARAGVRRGDVVIDINGHRVLGNDDLFFNIGSLTVDTEVTLKVLRNGQTVQLGPVQLTKLYLSEPSVATNKPPALGGLRVDYSSVVSQRSVDRGIADGVVIREIIGGSPAEKIDTLQLDRIITRVNDIPVHSPADYYREMERSSGRAELTVVDPQRGEVPVVLEFR